MATEIIMPQMGESIFEGTITKWLKKVGDSVAKDEPLFEISTDKVDAEIPSPVAGVLTEIKAAEGVTVAINTVVALVGTAHEVASTPAEKPAAVAKTPAAEKSPVPAAGAAVMSGTVVVMPQMGESIFEGTITKWLKQVGEHVAKDEPLFEISTDKVDAEIPAPAAGVLTQILSAEGTTVQINAVVAVIGGAVRKAEAPPQAVATLVEEPLIEEAAQAPEVEHPGGRLRSSPLVRRIAREKNLDLRLIKGTGSGGRITKEDALAFLANGGGGASAPVSGAVPVPALAPEKKDAAADASSSLPGQLVPMTRMRSIIAQRMVESMRISPHVHSVYKVDMTRVVRLREKHKAGYEQRHGVKLTYMPFICAAAIETLKKFPILNSSLEGEAIRYHKNINLGIAVALEWGLIVPVIRQAEERSFLELARGVVDLAERARSKKLKPEEVGGSTFTLTNSGVFGDEFGTPVINQPESAILAIGGLKKEAVVLTDAESNDTIGIRSMQHYCLGFDHRTIDGADAGKFMFEFKKTLEQWSGEIG